jgi:hypothetical protein
VDVVGNGSKAKMFDEVANKAIFMLYFHGIKDGAVRVNANKIIVLRPESPKIR